MSNYQQKNGTGTIWKNDKYVAGCNQPYAKGTVLDMDGNEVDIVLWVPKSDKIKGFNLTMQKPYKKTEQVESPAAEDVSDESGLPF